MRYLKWSSIQEGWSPRKMGRNKLE